MRVRCTAFFLLAACGVVAAQPVQRVDDAYRQRLAQREAEVQRQLRRVALGNSRLEFTPAVPTEGHTVRAKVIVLHGAAPAGHCPDPAGAAVRREDARTIVTVPHAPCANPLEKSAWIAELPIGRLPAGEQRVDLEVPNDLGLEPVRSHRLTVRRIGSEQEALAVATDEGPEDVARLLAARRFTPDMLDAALHHACSQAAGGREEAVARVLLGAGARAASALHVAAAGSVSCLRLLLAAGADPNLDLATQPGIPLGGGPDALRFKLAPAGTPLFFAVRTRQVENVRVLLAAGADPNRPFGQAQSAYAASMDLGDGPTDRELRALLESRGGSLTLVQRLLHAGRRVGGAAAGGAFLALCQLAAWTSGSCMH